MAGVYKRERKPLRDNEVMCADPNEWLDAVEQAGNMVYCEPLNARLHIRHCRMRLKHTDSEAVERRIRMHCVNCLTHKQKNAIPLQEVEYNGC